jgi:protein SCO1/2
MFRFFAVFFGVLISFGLIFSAVVLYVGPAAPPPLPQLYPAPAIEMTDARRETFSSDSLKGKVWIARVFFTSCPTVCPIMTDNLTKVMAAYTDEPDLHIVSLSVDPETDTPERLRDYAQMYKADLDQWHFLTGPIEQVNEVSFSGLKLGSADQPTHHSDRLVLIDRGETIRGYYHGTEDAEVAELIADIERLLKE